MINDTVHDPVCHMDIAPTTAAGTSDYKDITYYFCGMGCKATFDKNPEKVLQAELDYHKK